MTYSPLVTNLVKDYSLLNKTYTPRTLIKMQNQRNKREENFEHGIQLQLEDLPNKDGKVVVRGKYPNDDWWAKVDIDELEGLQMNTRIR